MKTKEEINTMVNQMAMALCHGGFGRLKAMLGAEAIEITENSFKFSFKMCRLANQFKIELDDFGRGYSSLALLNILPLDILKIDGDMVRNAARHDDFRIIRSAIQIAQLMGLETVIEGVETQDSLDKLREMGCDMIQGFFFSWPLRRDDFESYLLED